MQQQQQQQQRGARAWRRLKQTCRSGRGERQPGGPSHLGCCLVDRGVSRHLIGVGSEAQHLDGERKKESLRPWVWVKETGRAVLRGVATSQLPYLDGDVARGGVVLRHVVLCGCKGRGGGGEEGTKDR